MNYMGIGFFLGFIREWNIKIYYGLIAAVFGLAIIAGTMASSGAVEPDINFLELGVGIIAILLGDKMGVTAYDEVSN